MNYQLNELFNFNYSHLVRIYPLLESDTPGYYYAQIMKAYYQNNTSKLKEIKKNIRDPFIKVFCH